MTDLSDSIGIRVMEFLESQGMKFVDPDTGKPITAEDLKKRQQKRHTSTPKGKRIEK